MPKLGSGMNLEIPSDFSLNEGRNKSKSYQELLRLIAKSSDYNLYEVEDIMNHFVAHVQQLLRKGEIVKVSGLGVFKSSTIKPRTMPMGLIGEAKQIGETKTARFKPSTELTKAIRQQPDESSS